MAGRAAEWKDTEPKAIFIMEYSRSGNRASNGYMMKKQEPLPDIGEPIIELFAADTATLLAWTH